MKFHRKCVLSDYSVVQVYVVVSIEIKKQPFGFNIAFCLNTIFIQFAFTQDKLINYIFCSYTSMSHEIFVINHPCMNWSYLQ
jgi:hypothetical protein